jgi:hypothetical protein
MTYMPLLKVALEKISVSGNSTTIFTVLALLTNHQNYCHEKFEKQNHKAMY